MSFREFLNYKIIESENITISVYSLLISLVVILITFLILRITRKIFQRFIEKRKLKDRGYWSIYLIIRYFIWVIVIVVLLDTFGVRISVLLASIAALLIGVGLGIQQLFNDLSSGIILLIERNLQINDIIQLQDGTVGRVTEIGLRTSQIKTRDDIVLIVPNSKFVNDNIINWSHIDYKTRFSVKVGVAYGTDVELVCEVLLKCAFANTEIANYPKPFVRLNEFGESSLDFQLFFWVMESFYVENLKSDLRMAINREFKAHGIQIPFPQRDIHMKD
ncbi:MAG: mechanosensitive ion channel family protein [Marinifilaceae bacterium]